jgi:hypothetical protein
MIIVFLLAFALFAAALFAYDPLRAKPQPKVRKPSYLKNYIQYRHDSLQMHELLL